MRDSLRLIFGVVLLCLLGMAFHRAKAQEVGSRPPEVSDWRLFHHKNDQYWARNVTVTSGWRDTPSDGSKIQWSAAEVREIRLLAGITDDEPSDPILSLTGRNMRPDRNLLLTATPNNCLNLTVYAGFHHFKPVWTTDSLPDGRQICQQPGCEPPRVSVGEKHEISVMDFFRSTSDEPICDRFVSAEYWPKKNSFVPKNLETGPSLCWFDARNAGLNAAFRRAAGAGEILAILQDQPALSSRWYALVLQHAAEGFRVLFMQLPAEAWALPGLTDSQNRMTAAACYARAAASTVRVTRLEIPPKKLATLASALSRIDLHSGRCPRSPDTGCGLLLDGRTFLVQVGNNPTLRLTDVRGLKGWVNENPQLSDWVYRFLEESRRATSTLPTGE